MLWDGWFTFRRKLRTGHYCCILAGMRTGSNLLQSYLNQAEGIICLGELFNPAFVGVDRADIGEKNFAGYARDDIAARDANPRKFFNRIYAEAGDDSLVFRLFDQHGEAVIRTVLGNRNAKKVILTRDPLESFVSLELARATKQWLLRDEARRKTAQVTFDIPRFEEYAVSRRNYYSNLIKQLGDSQSEYQKIDYSDLGSLDAVNRIVEFIRPGAALASLPKSLVRQNPGPLSDKIANYAEVADYIESRVAEV